MLTVGIGGILYNNNNDNIHNIYHCVCSRRVLFSLSLSISVYIQTRDIFVFS